MTEFDKARDEAVFSEYCVDKDEFNRGANWAYEWFSKKLCSWEDDTGSEFVHVCILKDENAKLQSRADKLAEALEPFVNHNEFYISKMQMENIKKALKEYREERFSYDPYGDKLEEG